MYQFSFLLTYFM